MDIENVVQRLRAMNADGVGYVGHAADVIEALQNDLRIEILQRERKIAEADSFIKAIADTCIHAERVAAESQAREKVMLDALHHMCKTTRAKPGYRSAIVKRALEQQQDDTAIKAALAAERERCAVEVECRAGMRGIGGWVVLTAAASAIRALGDKP